MRPLPSLACLLLLLSAAPALAHPSITVEGAYAKPTLDGVSSGVAFLNITSRNDDALIGVVSDAAATGELHNHVIDNGVMQMRQVERIELLANQRVKLAPGGLHIMLFGMKQKLKIGDTLRLTLNFAQAQALTLDIPVRDDAPMAHTHH